MSSNPNGNAAEVPGQVDSHAKERVTRMVTPEGLVAEGHTFILVTGSVAIDGSSLWPVTDMTGDLIGLLPTLKGVKEHVYYGVGGVPQLYVEVGYAKDRNLPLVDGRRDTLKKDSVAQLVNIDGAKPWLPKRGERLVVEQPKPEPVRAVRSREHGTWRERGKRLVGALALASVLLAAGFLASLSPNGVKQKGPSSPEAVKILDVLPSLPPIGAAPPAENPTTPVPDAENIGQERHKPSITPDYDAPTVWAMFARVTGKAYAQAAILNCANKLSQYDFIVTYHGDPAKDKIWWITITGPGGKKYTDDKDIARLLASVS